MSGDDVARFLADSPDRRRVLAHLVETPGSPAHLADALSLSRRSAQRHLGAFADRGWVEKRDGEYHLTTTGALVVDEHESYLEALDGVDAFGDVYRHLPDADHAPDPRWLADADVTRASAEQPQAPVHHYVASVGGFGTDRVRMVAPVLSRLFHDVHADLALEGTHTDLVLSAETIERARDLNPAEFAVVVSVGVLDLYRHPDPVEFGLTLGDGRLLLGVYDADGHLYACVESTDADFYGWAEGLFERYRDRSEPVDPPLSLPFDLGGG